MKFSIKVQKVDSTIVFIPLYADDEVAALKHAERLVGKGGTVMEAEAFPEVLDLAPDPQFRDHY